MQKINIKKLTKEQMAKLLEEAQAAQQAAEKAEAERFEEGVKLAEENEKLHGQIGELTAKLKESEKALDEARRRAQNMTTNLEMLDEARKKAEAEKRELAEQLGKRTVEFGSVKTELESVRTQLAEEKNANSSKGKLLDGMCERIRTIAGVRDTYRDSFRWCIDHPWRNLWRCFVWRLKGERRAS